MSLQEAPDNVTLGIFQDHENTNEKESAKYIINIYVNFVICGSIAIWGSISNVINMIIFKKLGLKDSMSVGLVALSLTDFFSSFVCISGVTYIIWDKYFPNAVVDPLSVEYVSFGWARDLLSLCSGWITTLLSMERCICVVLPFKVKLIFTKVRCIVAILIIYVVHISVYIPAFSSQMLSWSRVEVGDSNDSILVDRLIVMYSDNRFEIMLFNDIATGAVLPFPSQALVLVSVVCLIYGLRSSSRIRNLASDTNKERIQGGKGDSNLSGKEVRLVKVVLFLAIILTLCNIPRFLAVYAKQIFPQAGYGNEQEHIHIFLWNLTIFMANINCSVNIFVYLIVNSNYRQKFKELFRLTSKDQIQETFNRSRT